MATEPFNPLAVARDLEAAGVVREQAEAHAEALRQAVNADRGELATNADLYRVALIQVGATVAILTALRFLPI